jgi:hypothetical protein
MGRLCELYQIQDSIQLPNTSGTAVKAFLSKLLVFIKTLFILMNFMSNYFLTEFVTSKIFLFSVLKL